MFYIVLIPKVSALTSFDKFRPISLCFVFYKILAKILVNRISVVLDKLIAPEQWVFVKGRRNFQNISLTQEMVK